ncbi:FAD synthetase family protein [Bradyrhizobium sp. BR13661]|jgi:riboflavin kinase/FMN adenylyltransferase|uniref:FAD synthetase family protein n=1 Tax=Bradyrhizobium sp. BR13661 TaxID=2940622 RepID=UPI00247338A3|nr:FAD synthetase family protein [Bradyrhizobium sp. BR13661]MDH6261785.1 FAD synthase [Bradyrhizobium sp. BR13661]
MKKTSYQAQCLEGLSGSLGRPSVVTIGTFDGLHAGHQAVLGAAMGIAASRSLRSIAITFDPRPETVLSPNTALPDVIPVFERIRRIHSFKFDEVVVLRFTRKLASLPGEAFLAKIEALYSMQVLCVGEDFALGRGASCNIATMRALGVDVVSVPLVAGSVAGQKASSTNMRRAVAEGVEASIASRFA